jgi:hypothetical protein
VNERPRWDFDYVPIRNGGGDDGSPESDLVVATTDDIDPGAVAEQLASIVGDVDVTPLFSAHPIFWTRVRSSTPLDRVTLAHAVTASGSAVRYIASARRGSQRLAPRLLTDMSRPRRASDWTTRPRTSHPEPNTPWRWFLRSEGVNVERTCCGTGAGTRLAVIDNDGKELDKIELDAEVLVAGDTIPRAGAHAGLLLGWAVGARSSEGTRFRGIAPDASPRLYCIPKSSQDVVSLPLAIVRAVEDGADVIVCATYVEGLMSELLDDALEFSSTLGRGGKGTPVVMPTGREMSSAADSTHSSLSLGLADPASDPRVFCVGPSARDGGWFLWRDRHGKIRPFANRGPAVRWLAPGDDLAYPFANDDRPAHAESSGAAAVAAGVLLLILGTNPALAFNELEQLLVETASPLEPAQRSSDPELGDRADLLPLGRDADGHNAKHGYGRLNASAACLACRDPIGAALIRIGEHDAAQKYHEARSGIAASFYSDAFGRWAALEVLNDVSLRHAACSVARAIRLLTINPERSRNQVPGALIRQLTLLVRLLSRSKPTGDIARELGTLDRRMLSVLGDEHATLTLETKLLAFATILREPPPPTSRPRLRAVDDRSSWPTIATDVPDGLSPNE